MNTENANHRDSPCNPLLCGRIEDAQRLIRWKLADDEKLKRCAMWVGGFNEVEQMVLIKLIEKPPPESVKFSTAVCNQTRWTVWEMVRTKKQLKRGDSVKRKQSYTMNLTEWIEAQEMREAIAVAMEKIKDERLADIIQKRMLGMTYESIGHDHKITPERVRQLALDAIKRLQNPNVAGGLVFHCST